MEHPVGTTAYYRSTDPLKNFKIRVRIRKLVPAAPRSTTDRELVSAQSARSNQLPNVRDDIRETAADPEQDECSQTFSWQERIYGRTEVELCKDLKNCDTTRKKAVHHAIRALSQSEHQFHGGLLFTYVDADINSETIPLVSLTDAENITETYLGTDTAPYRPRRPRIEDLNLQSNQREVFRLMSPRHNFARATTSMYIMMDLPDPKTASSRSANKNDGVVMCKIRVDSDGVLAVQPDFNASKKPYIIQVKLPGGGTDRYEYYLEHVSENMTRMDVEKEKQLLRALYQRYYNHRSALVGSKFDKPQAGFTRLFYSGEIVDADGFDQDDIFVHFLLETPSGWSYEWGSSENKEPAHLSSQVAQRGKDESHFFGCPFAWNMEYSLEPRPQTDSGYQLDWPRLLFEVVSLDSWNRYRVEGYGFLDVLSTVGSAVETIHTWTPTGTGTGTGLRRYFVGGGAELEELNYVSIPQDVKGKEFSRYGFRTMPSGRLKVRHSLIMQHGIASEGGTTQSHGSRRGHRGFRGDTERSSFATFDPAVEGVLEAFKRARRRLLEARGILSVD